jgi:hypothetical protein
MRRTGSTVFILFLLTTLANAAVSGFLSFYSSSLSATTALTVKNSPARLNYINVYNPNTSIEFVQIFDEATVNLGTDTPKHSYPIPAGGFWDASFGAGGVGEAYQIAINIYATTTAGGSSAPSQALTINGQYQ